ncbi:MAG: hypothetical protein ABSB15_16025 [Bryobacteraceae bacterium]|jgi:hypothetical protein
MNPGIERRRSTRARIEAAADLIWKDEAGYQQFENGRIIDCSSTGASITSPQALATSSHLIVRSSGIGLLALARVRSCSWWRTQYRLGIEFVERAVLNPTDTAAEPEYHELMRAGAAGELERMDRLYSQFELRYGPENRESGDSEVFLRIREAHRILKVPRANQPESALTKPLGAFGWPEGLRELRDKRLRVLGLLYKKRMSDHKNPSLSARELETLTGLASDEVGFIVWYLREKGAVALNDYSSDYAICAAGVDILESAQEELEKPPAVSLPAVVSEPPRIVAPSIKKRNRNTQ